MWTAGAPPLYAQQQVEQAIGPRHRRSVNFGHLATAAASAAAFFVRSERVTGKETATTSKHKVENSLSAGTPRRPVNSAKMEDNVARACDQQIALTRAFDAAREELGIGFGSLNVWKSELLGRILSRLAREGDWDPGTLARKAADSFLIETTHVAGANLDRTFHRWHAE